MAEVIGVRFKDGGKTYFFGPNGIKFNSGDSVIVETARGIECGKVDCANKEVPEDEIVKPLKDVIRKATPNDLKLDEANRKLEETAAGVFENLVGKHDLNMKLAGVEYTFDRKKIIFYFTAPSRVDFRSLVKDLASFFKTRIELRQIGVRDEARMMGGVGICGRPFCCKQFLTDFQPVTLKMAKEQGMSLNTSKISGACGRLMCCIKFESEGYEYLLKKYPKTGAYVNTPDGKGVVTEVNLMSGKIKVRLDKAQEAAPRTFELKDLDIIKDASITLSKEELAEAGDVED